MLFKRFHPSNYRFRLQKYKKCCYPNLDILLVHLPTSEHALNASEVAKVYNEFEMNLPCCLDNNHDLKDIINPNSYTPQMYLYIDNELVMGGIGDMVIENIDKKLLELNKKIHLIVDLVD